MSLWGSYADHLKALLEDCADFLPRLGVDELIISAGIPRLHFEDDQTAPFRTHGNFAYFCPLEGPFHLLRIVPGKRPLLVRYAPDDYWHAQDEFPPRDPEGSPADWVRHFEVRSAGDVAALFRELGESSKNTVFLGQDTRFAEVMGWSCNPHLVSSHLQWRRSFKSQYEIECLAQANTRGALGHRAAHETFLRGGSEFEIAQEYLKASLQTENEMPYSAIVGVGRHAAVLHYQNKDRSRQPRRHEVLLIDAGARVSHYGSDITRTYAGTFEGHASSPSETQAWATFCELVAGVESVQQRLCEAVRPWGSFPQLQTMMHRELTQLLMTCGIIKPGLDPQDPAALRIVTHFIPHGIGHLLGIFVHDVGGKIASPKGEPLIPREPIPYLRSYRTLEPGMVLTVEPGIYFIESLLFKLRQTAPLASWLDWELVDRLVPFGGIRIEDNVVVTAAGHSNLTRQAFDQVEKVSAR